MSSWRTLLVTGLVLCSLSLRSTAQSTSEEKPKKIYELRLYTAANGWFLKEEDKLGSIEEGKLGDIVVLNEDYFQVPDDRIRKLHSVLTIVDGKVVHNLLRR